VTTPILRLEATGMDPLVLNPYSGYVVQSLDLGDAATRAVVQDAPDTDGTIDTTAYFGARSVTMSVALVPKLSGQSKELMRRRLRAFTHPKLRPYLYMQFDGQAEQRIMLRRGAFSNIVQNNAMAPVVVQFVAPYGVIQSSVLHVANANASASGTEGGRTYDKTYDKTYTGGAVTGQVQVSNLGNADAHPLIRIYGPCTDPVVFNDTTGQRLAFTGLTILVGEFLEIDTRAKTVFYNGVSTDSRYSKFNFTTSQWWTLGPGVSLVRFLPATGSPPSNAEINWRDTWL
jgi:hypothetical protein